MADQRNRNTAMSLLGIVIGMLMLSYASVPLYRLFCQYTGFGGTTQDATAAPEYMLNRRMTVMFNADVMPGLPWEFAPEQRKVSVRLGEQKLVFFKATNKGMTPLKGVSTFNVTPDAAGIYFMKVKCFCYEEQVIGPGETVTMPVSFFIDPALDKDKNLEPLNTLTLSYTFFESATK